MQGGGAAIAKAAPSRAPRATIERRMFKLWLSSEKGDPVALDVEKVMERPGVRSEQGISYSTTQARRRTVASCTAQPQYGQDSEECEGLETERRRRRRYQRSQQHHVATNPAYRFSGLRMPKLSKYALIFGMCLVCCSGSLVASTPVKPPVAGGCGGAVRVRLDR